MARGKAHTPEEIVAKLRQVEVLVGQGKSVSEAVRGTGVTEATYYRWRTEFGGLKLDQVRRLAELVAGGAWLEPHRRDRYSRLLAVVRDGRGRDVAIVMIREGLARPYAGERRRSWCG